jgi:hypothetical protein
MLQMFGFQPRKVQAFHISLRLDVAAWQSVHVNTAGGTDLMQLQVALIEHHTE